MAAFAAMLVPHLALAGHSSHSSGGGHHTVSRGGHYVGGHGSSHRGGHYVNPKTGNHYVHHEAPMAGPNPHS